MNEFLNLPPLRKPRKVKPKPTPIPQWCKDRYNQAHEHNFNQAAKEAGHYFKPTMPDCTKSGGLQQAIIKFLLWSGHRATRVSSAGRMIKGRYIPGATRKGAADISSTIKINGIGCSVMWEVKINLDKPSEYQLIEQKLEEAAGGKYFFVKTFQHFLEIFDSLFVSL